MFNKSPKISETFFKISSVLEHLLTEPMDYNDIYNCLVNKGFEVEFSKETFNKYLNTLRALGLQINKLLDGKFHLLNFLVQVELNKEEIKAFKDFETTILKYGSDENIKTLIDLKKKIFKYFDYESQQFLNEPLEQILNTKIGILVKQFDKICSDNQKIIIEYDKEILTVEPKEVLSINNIVYLDCINLKDLKPRKLILKKINLIKQLPTKNSFSSVSNSVIFQLSGKLAYTYKLKPNKSIISKKGQMLVIKNENEDFEFLTRRLIRYQNLCKILQPAEFKEYFKEYINKITKLYDKEEFHICDF